jgi:DNA-directed RNA polymerase specialized sigma24 family protein
MSDPFAQSFAFGLAVAEDIEEPTEPSADPTDTALEAPSEPPPSQVRIGEPDPPANDTARAAGPAAEVDRIVLFRRLSDPRLRRDLLTYLVKKRELAAHRAEDVVQQTYLRALRARTWPDDGPKMFAWMKAIADRSFVDDLRKRDRQSEFEEPHEDIDLAEEPRDDEEARHVAEVAHMVAAESAQNAETLQMIKAQAEGESRSAVAARGSISMDIFNRRRSRFVSAVKKRLAEIASLTTTSLGLMLLVHMLTVVTLTMVGSAPPVPGVHDPLPALPAHEDAGAVRDRAFDHLRYRDYGRCLELLNRAKKLDPEGDRDPKVVSARRDAEKALREGAPTTQP